VAVSHKPRGVQLRFPVLPAPISALEAVVKESGCTEAFLSAPSVRWMSARFVMRDAIDVCTASSSASWSLALYGAAV
jgi:hypothetical protein